MALSFNTNLSNVVARYIQLLKIQVTKTSLIQSLEQNPYYPSLYSISDTLTKFGIDNQAFTITPEDLSKIQTPFIAYYRSDFKGKDFILVKQLTDKRNNNNKQRNIGYMQERQLL